MNVFSIVDNNVIEHLSVPFFSMRHHHPRRDIFWIVAHQDVDEGKRLVIDRFAREVGINVDWRLASDLKPSVDHVKLREFHITRAALLKLNMQVFFDNSDEPILYLDVDTVVNGSLDQLFEIDLSDRVAAVVREPLHCHLREFGVDKSDYFNSGVMLLNMQNWRRKNIGSRAVEFMRQNPDSCLYWDQCALNVALSGEVAFLDSSFNATYLNWASERIFNPKIIHYAGREKPWVDASRHPYGAFWHVASCFTPFPVSFRPEDPIPATLMEKWRANTRKILMGIARRL